MLTFPVLVVIGNGGEKTVITAICVDVVVYSLRFGGWVWCLACCDGCCLCHVLDVAVDRFLAACSCCCRVAGCRGRYYSCAADDLGAGVSCCQARAAFVRWHTVWGAFVDIAWLAIAPGIRSNGWAICYASWSWCRRRRRRRNRDSNLVVTPRTIDINAGSSKTAT